MNALFLVVFLAAPGHAQAPKENGGTSCTLKEFEFDQPALTKAAIGYLPRIFKTIKKEARPKLAAYDLKRPEICTFNGTDCNGKPRKLALVHFKEKASESKVHVLMIVSGGSKYEFEEGGWTSTPSKTLAEWRRKAICD